MTPTNRKSFIQDKREASPNDLKLSARGGTALAVRQHGLQRSGTVGCSGWLSRSLVFGDIPVGCQRTGVAPSSNEVAVCVRIARTVDKCRVLDGKAPTPKEEDLLLALRLRNAICESRNNRWDRAGLHGANSRLIFWKP